MFKTKKNQKKNANYPYLIAHILRKKGSIGSFVDYINEHPISKDVARKDIINMKYLYSKCSNNTKNLVKRMIDHYDWFTVEVNGYIYGEKDNIIKYRISDRKNDLWFDVEDRPNVKEVTIRYGAKWTSSENDALVILYATKSVRYMEDNMERIKKSQKQEEVKEQYIGTYSK